MIVGTLIVALMIASLWLFRKRSKTILENWAKENKVEIISSKQEFLETGPFKWWTNSRNQTIYHLRVRERDGLERSAWARCGSYFGGVVFSDEIEVRWDKL